MKRYIKASESLGLPTVYIVQAMDMNLQEWKTTAVKLSLEEAKELAKNKKSSYYIYDVRIIQGDVAKLANLKVINDVDEIDACDDTIVNVDIEDRYRNHFREDEKRRMKQELEDEADYEERLYDRKDDWE